jgi:Domain of unknown function (DUF222)/HNH endonuclease
MFVGDPSVLSAEELEGELAAQAAHVDAGLCGLVELVAECERRLPLALEGTTFAGWLAWRCSLSPRQAREHERIGKRLAGLPLTHDAFARGELSYAKVSVLTRIAERECEEQLIELARVMTASQLERAIGALRRLSREEATAQQEREFLDYFWTEEGWLSVRARLAAEEGALLVQALEKAREALWRRRQPGEVAAGAGDASDTPAPVEPPAGRVTNAEALVALAELALAHQEGDRSGGERYQVVVHVDAQTLAEDAGGRCELADGRPLAAETARRLSCDASLVELREQEGELLSLGRKRRTVSPPLQRALMARDRGCRFPGCERTRFVDAHHVNHWSQGGETSLDNLVVLCRRHHRLVHEHGYTLRLGDDGEPRFENQHGVAIVSVPRPPPSDRQALRERHRRLGLLIDSDSCRNGTGDRMNLSLAVDALMSVAG